MSIFNGLYYKSSNTHRNVKKGNFDGLDRPKGFAHMFKQEEKPKPMTPVSPHHPIAHSIRMRGVKFD